MVLSSLLMVAASSVAASAVAVPTAVQAHSTAAEKHTAAQASWGPHQVPHSLPPPTSGCRIVPPVAKPLWQRVCGKGIWTTLFPKWTSNLKVWNHFIKLILSPFLTVLSSRNSTKRPPAGLLSVQKYLGISCNSSFFFFVFQSYSVHSVVKLCGKTWEQHRILTQNTWNHRRNVRKTTEMEEKGYHRELIGKEGVWEIQRGTGFHGSLKHKC